MRFFSQVISSITTQMRLLLISTALSYTFFTPLLHAADTIKLPLNNWASQNVLSKSIGNLLQEQGLEVEYIKIRSDKQWGALARGKLHFQVEVWSPSMADAFSQYPKVLDAGTHTVKVREDWWYPSWVESMCPGLPDWQALNKCAQLFSSNGSDLGTFYTGPWDYEDHFLIRALKLNFRIERVKTDQELWQLLKQAKTTRQPILLLNWSPNWTDSEIKGSFVEFPAHSTECETDPAYGVNKEMTHDCGNPQRGWLKKAKWDGLSVAYPCVDAFVEQINFTTEMVARASVLGSNKDLTLTQAADLWLEEFGAEARKWLPEKCTIWRATS